MNIPAITSFPANAVELQAALRALRYPSIVEVPRKAYDRAPAFENVYILNPSRDSTGKIVRGQVMCCDCELVPDTLTKG